MKKYLVIILTVLCAAVKIATIPASLWEWDDMLFARALTNYDVVTHSPQPPGFPLFIGLAKPLYWMFRDEYVALTIVSVIFTCLLAPALYYLYLAVFKDWRVAFAGALLCSFMPNVWFYSGSGRSDMPAMVAGIIGMALLLNGRLYAGLAVIGLGMGIRVTVLLVTAPIIAYVVIDLFRRKQYRQIITGGAIFGACILVWYIPLIADTGWAQYNTANEAHRQYILHNDSIFSGSRLTTRFNRYLNDPFGRSWIKVPVYIFMIVGIVVMWVKGKKRELFLMMIAFIPYMIFAFMMNAPSNAPLYSLPYMPLFTGLAAYGLIYLFPKQMGFYATLLLAILSAYWVWPSVRVRHKEVSPPMQAVRLIEQKIDQKENVLCFSQYYQPHAFTFFPAAAKFPLETCQAQNFQGKVFIISNAPHDKGMLLGEYHWGIDQQLRKTMIRLSIGHYMDAYVYEVK